MDAKLLEIESRLLSDLKALKLLRVTGSYADGSQREDSDIDFFMRPDHPERHGRNIKKVIAVFAKYGVNWDSNLPSYIYTHSKSNWLPIHLEVGDIFQPRKNRLKEVEILGVSFKTY